MLALVLSLLAFAPAASSDTTRYADPARPIVGSWECVGGPCIDEEIAFWVEDGKDVFRSWIHQHPASFGEWNADGRTLTVTVRDLVMTFRIVRVNERELILREEGEKKNARYRRVPE